MFSELLVNKELYGVIINVIPKIETLCELKYEKNSIITLESSIYAIKEIEIFVDSINFLYEKIKNIKTVSKAMMNFQNVIIDYCQSNSFTNLTAELSKASKKICNAKSVTIGVNLDPQLNPIEAGIISVNDELFISGNIVDRLLRVEFKTKEYTCQSPLSPIRKNVSVTENAAVNMAFNHALNKIFFNAIASWKPVIKRYVSEESNFLCGLLDELKFIQSCIESLNELKSLGLPLCKPVITKEKEKILGLYNPLVAAKLKREESKQIVKNDISFDDDGKIYILTGPNQGGKSVFTSAAGFAYSMLHLGLLIPANDAEMRIIDGIFTHFPQKDENSLGKGRLGEECSHISSINNYLTADSLFLFDEALSSTSGSEAVYIATDILAAYGIIGVKGIFATHLHDLATKTNQINEMSNNKSKVDNLCAIIDLDTNEREYIVKRQAPDGLSYARDIARQYGLGIDEILSKK
ncbi:MAG: MutS-related protein [Saccharofermentanales bacterium]